MSPTTAEDAPDIDRMCTPRVPSIFVYAPTSGDRVLVEGSTPAVVIIKWANGCRHVVGECAHLRYVTADAGRWWRAEARNMAADLVLVLGGIAWDENGTINLAVPREGAACAVKAMTALRRLAGANRHIEGRRGSLSSANDAENLLAMWRVKAAVWVVSEDGREGRLVPYSNVPLAPVLTVRNSSPDDTGRTYIGGAAGEGVSWSVSAPWAIKCVSGGVQTRQRD